MLKVFPKYLNFENISKKRIRVPEPLHIFSNIKHIEKVMKGARIN